MEQKILQICNVHCCELNTDWLLQKYCVQSNCVPKIEEILGVDAAGHVNVELKQLQKLSL